MLTLFGADYQRYKEKSAAEQILRISNMIFAVFTFWNLARWQITAAELPISQTILWAALFAVLGIIYGLGFVLRFTAKEHVLILPIAAIGFAISNQSSTRFLEAFAVPLCSAVILGMVRLIISISNKINHITRR